MNKDITKTLKNKATGCFPPIYVCGKKENNKDKDKDENDNLKIRGFTQNEVNNIVSLKDLMEDRKQDTKPFINL
ncbi:hypothetical protein BMW23_0691 [Bodo saltans virus]|uniref:Uncharacterized protein n=1 Tax=Bodo saltans virus TaxID=2024608 RepID=A0A2H4UV48_9VIRU|nr:hypothetical protein QJ851_gp0674 [Bodo saltans virus]ATZ80737.1 hypothetical protein BMW23_0691 [Bodo saltans virus]